MSGKLKHMERSHRSENNSTDFSGFERHAYIKGLKAKAKNPKGILGKMIDKLRKKQDR